MLHQNHFLLEVSPPNKAETPMHSIFYNTKKITVTEVAQETLVNKARG